MIHNAEGSQFDFVGLERQAFYIKANQAYAVILTGERRFYGSAVLRKGVIHPPEQ